MRVRVYRSDEDGLWWITLESANGAQLGGSVRGWDRRNRAVSIADTIAAGGTVLVDD